MKAWLSFALIVMLLGVSIAFADDGEDDHGWTNAKKYKKNTYKGYKNPGYTIAPSQMREKRGEMREEWGEMREKYKRMKENYQYLKEEYKEMKNEWREARETWKGSKDKDEEERMEIAKTYISKGIDVAIKHLELIKDRIENDSTLTEEEKAKLIEKIDEYISWLEQKKQEIPSINTTTELIQTTKELRNEWKEVKKDAKGVVGKIAKGKIEYVLDKAESAGERAEKLIEKYKEKGYDTTKAEQYLDQFRNKLEEAKQKYEELKEKYEEVETAEDAKQLTLEINQYIKEISSDVKEGYKNIKELIKELKELETEGKE